MNWITKLLFNTENKPTLAAANIVKVLCLDYSLVGLFCELNSLLLLLQIAAAFINVLTFWKPHRGSLRFAFVDIKVRVKSTVCNKNHCTMQYRHEALSGI